MSPRVVTLTVFGPPRTKKTSNQLVRATRFGRPKILPSKAWRDWCKSANVRYVVMPAVLRAGQLCRVPVQYPVNCCALFYRDANRGDATGFYQGLADLLEKRGVVSNDKFIESWDGSRLLKDAHNPRVEITLTEITAP